MLTIYQRNLTSQNITGTTVNFAAFDVTSATDVSAHVITGGAGLTGTAKLQWSNDGTNWVDIPSVTASIVSNGSVVLSASNVFTVFVRLVVTVSAGTAATTSIIVGKQK